MSSGRPTRRTGVRAAWCSTPSPSRPLASRRPQHRRVDEPGRDGVDGDALRAELEGERLGEADHAGLGRDVVGHQRLAALRARRRDVDDATPAGLDHVGHHGLAAVEGAGEVHLEDPVPLLEVDLEERREALEPGVVDQDRRARRARSPTAATAASMPARSVTSAATPDGGAAGGGDLGRGLVGGVAVAVEDRRRRCRRPPAARRWPGRCPSRRR